VKADLSRVSAKARDDSRRFGLARLDAECRYVRRATDFTSARASLKDAGDDIELGMSARIAVSAAAGASRIEVPVAALYSRGDQPQVFLVGPDGAVRAQAVKTAGISNERVVIEAGLKPGDVVVAAGAALLRAGQRVRVLEGK